MTKIFKNVWFRCIFTLLIIAVISGGLLSVLNDVLYVSSEERTERAIAKIYGEKVTVDEIVLDASADEDKITYDFGSINKIYKIGNDVLFQSTGFNGYKNGTVTLWIKVTESNGIYSLNKIVLEDYTKQTLMSKFGADYYDGFVLTDVTAAYKNGEGLFSTSTENENHNPNTGATYTATAHCNAVNCVIKYLGEKK